MSVIWRRILFTIDWVFLCVLRYVFLFLVWFLHLADCNAFWCVKIKLKKNKSISSARLVSVCPFCRCLCWFWRVVCCQSLLKNNLDCCVLLFVLLLFKIVDTLIFDYLDRGPEEVDKESYHLFFTSSCASVLASLLSGKCIQCDLLFHEKVRMSNTVKKMVQCTYTYKIMVNAECVWRSDGKRDTSQAGFPHGPYLLSCFYLQLHDDSSFMVISSVWSLLPAQDQTMSKALELCTDQAQGLHPAMPITFFQSADPSKCQLSAFSIFLSKATTEHSKQPPPWRYSYFHVSQPADYQPANADPGTKNDFCLCWLRCAQNVQRISFQTFLLSA